MSEQNPNYKAIESRLNESKLTGKKWSKRSRQLRKILRNK